MAASTSALPTIGATVQDSVAAWPDPPPLPANAPNVLIMMLDDVGFADFGRYGSEIDTPTIDALAARGLRYSGFHTTAMCSTTRAALLTGRNHHSVGMGCLANFDTGYPGYRGKISQQATTIAEWLGPFGYRNYYVGKWHATTLTETGPTGPFDGWPLGRGFDRFYGFLDAETDQYLPELVRDNSHIQAPGTHATGYHLTEDLFTEAIRFVQGHIAGAPTDPWLMMVMPGACHAPHQAPRELIDKYDAIFAKGWDQTRADRLHRQIDLGLVPPGTNLPPLNDGVEPWESYSDDERTVFTRLNAAYAAMLEHADTHFGRLISFLEQAGQLDNTLVLALSDNGASQEGGPLGFVNAMGPYSGLREPIEAKLARLDDIGGPDTHSNFPWGWAMAANTPLRRYKQNTHGGGVRDPLVVAGPGVATGIRHNFCHVSDVLATLSDAIGVDAPADIEGTSFATTFAPTSASAGAGAGGTAHTTNKRTQYFEMFGHRGIWHEGWKAVAWHQSGTPFDDDVWELYDLSADFNECRDLAGTEPERLQAMIELWWEQARVNQVLPLDDRFVARFAENAERHRGDRTRYVFWNGVGHVPTDVAPDLRSRSYEITAYVDIPDGGAEGVLIAHGDATSGYSLFVRDGHLVHDLNVGGHHQELVSERPIPTGPTRLGFRLVANPDGGPNARHASLLINDDVVAEMDTDHVFVVLISWSGLDVGFDRGTTVADYDGTGQFLGPFAFTGVLEKVEVVLVDDQAALERAHVEAELARD